MVTLMAGPVPSEPNSRILPTQRSSSNGSSALGVDHEIRPEIDEYRGRGPPLDAMLRIVPKAIAETPASSKMPWLSCMSSTSARCRVAISLSKASSVSAYSLPSGVRMWVGSGSPVVSWRPMGSIEEQFGKSARRQPGERAAIGKTSKRQPPIAFDAMPADFCGIQPFTGHRFDRVTKDGTDVTEFNSHGAILVTRMPSCSISLATPLGRSKVGPAATVRSGGGPSLHTGGDPPPSGLSLHTQAGTQRSCLTTGCRVQKRVLPRTRRHADPQGRDPGICPPPGPHISWFSTG